MKKLQFKVKLPSDELFEFIKHKNLSIVPVISSGELEQYHIFQTSHLRSVQNYFHTKCGYTWPILCLPTRKKCIHLQVLSPIHSHIYETAQGVKTEFKHCIRRVNNTGVDKQIVF